MAQHNAFYAQSGGVTAVINASACGVIEACRQAPDQIGKVYAGHNGIIGALTEDLIDVTQESDDAIAALRHTPGGAFGSCRYKLKDIDTHRAQYERLIEVFKAHDIRYFFYNGGGDSADTCLKVSQLSEKLGYPLTAIHVPKTVDNDLPITDNSPGFGSVAKYIATSTREASLDIASMCATSTKVFVLEVMGRDTGHIALSTGISGGAHPVARGIVLSLEKFDRIEGIDTDAGTLIAGAGVVLETAQEAARDYVLKRDPSEGAPLINIFGGKITTYRRLAESMLELIEKGIGRKGPRWTAGAALPGGDFPVGSFDAEVAQLQTDYPFLEPAQARRYVRQYGTLAWHMLGEARSRDDLGPHFGAGLHAVEVDYLMAREWAVEAADVLWRRTKRGLRLNSKQVAALEGHMASLRQAA
nr:diphosphate--fructose-6-phosphate 1-phosphotransferase [uncultured Halomonas sp.]